MLTSLIRYSGCSYLKIRQYGNMSTMSTHVFVCVYVSVYIYMLQDYCTCHVSVIFIFM